MNEFERLFVTSGLSLDRLRSFLAVAEHGNIAKAAKGDPNRQSQFSRQVKELEGFFGVALTRRVGRRIELTDEGLLLGKLIRSQFAALDDFREALAGKPVSVRLGAAASVLEWIVIPKLSQCREALGNVVIDLEQLRSAEVVRGVADGRLDFGIVREDAVPAGMKLLKLRRIGYALFAPKAAWRGKAGVEGVFRDHAFGELLPGGQFHDRYLDLLGKKGWHPRVVARAGSFLQLAKMVRSEGLAAVLPAAASIEFNRAEILSEALPWAHERTLVMISNPRSVARLSLLDGF